MRNKATAIKKAIAYHIRKQYPDAKLSEIEEKFNEKGLRITVPEISRLLNLLYLPTLNRIIDIENSLDVEIIKVNFVDQTDYLATINDRLERIEKALNLGPKETISTGETIIQTMNKNKSLYNQIIIDPFYSTNFNTLLSKLTEAFTPIALSAHKDLKKRFKERYISINLVNKSMKTGGYHIMMMRHSRPKQILNLEFITSRYILFKDFLLNFSDFTDNDGNKTLNDMVLQLKGSRKLFQLHLRKDGHPSVIYSRPLIEEDIAMIVKMALWTYNDQTKK
ncbi:MAG: hypothetical protein WCI71_11305 [Bacteroidota bacterium]